MTVKSHTGGDSVLSAKAVTRLFPLPVYISGVSVGGNMHFFKIHHGFCNNPKFNLISHRTKQPKAVVLGIITSLLEYASMQKPRGSIDGFSTEAYSFDLGINEGDIVTVCNALRDIGFILGSSIRNWEEYQTYDRTGAERQRKYRENKKIAQSSITDVTERNALRNTEEKRRDKKRKENNKYISNILPPEWINLETWDEFISMRLKLKAINSDRALKSIINSLDRYRTNGHDPNEILEKSIRNSWKDVFEPKGQNNATHSNNKPKSAHDVFGSAWAGAGGLDTKF